MKEGEDLSNFEKLVKKIQEVNQELEIMKSDGEFKEVKPFGEKSGHITFTNKWVGEKVLIIKFPKNKF